MPNVYRGRGLSIDKENPRAALEAIERWANKYVEPRLGAEGGSTTPNVSTEDSPWSGIHHPDRPPTSDEVVGGSSDEFIGSLKAAWRDGNIGSSVWEHHLDAAFFEIEAGSSQNLRGKWLDAPSGNFLVAAKMMDRSTPGTTSSTSMMGLWMLVAGTEASPSKIVEFETVNVGANEYQFRRATRSSYTAAASDASVSGAPDTNVRFHRHFVYLAMRYTESTNAVEFRYSFDGWRWRESVADLTLGGSEAPISIGAFGNDVAAAGRSRASYHFFRTFTAASRVSGLIVGA